jgi:hypothetical protein
MLDEIDLAKMSDLEQDRWLKEQKLFVRSSQPKAVPAGLVPQPDRVSAIPPEKSPGISAPEPPAASIQPAPVPLVQATSVSSPTPPVPTAPEVSKPQEQPQRPAAASAPAEAVPPLVLAQPVAPKRGQEVVKKVKEDAVPAKPKPAQVKGAPGLTGVVSRDREALARLFTSF